MRTKILYVLAICCLSMTTATAQVQILSFDECVSMALSENIKVRTGRNKVSSAFMQKKEAFTNYLPEISLSGTGMAANEHLIQIPLQFPPDLPIPPQNIQMVKSGVVANVTAILPVYAGGQIYYGNRLAKVATEVEQLKLKQSENEVRMTVAQYYWQIILLKEKVRTVKAINRQLASIYEDAEAAYQTGVSTRNDVLQVDLKKNEMESTSLELNSNIEILKMLLAQFIGISDAASFDVGFGVLSDGVKSPQTVMITPEITLSSTPEYQLLDRQIEVAEMQKKITRGEFLPKVAIGGGYFYNNLLDHSQNSLIGMVTVSVPISWKSGFSMKRRKLAVENAMMDMSDGSERLVIGMRKAYSDLDVAYRNIKIATKSIEQAKENLRMHEDFYQAGTATMSDLLDAQTLYQQSCDRLSEAVATYEIKMVEYLVMTGR